MMERDHLFVNGAWVKPLSDAVIEVVDAATEEVVATVPAGSSADAGAAVEAAAAAFPDWAASPLDERVKCLQRISEALQARSEDIAQVVTTEVGMPLYQSRVIQAGLPVLDFLSTAQAAEAFCFEERVGSSLILREPAGVVAAITPWNYPLHQVAAKVAPALAAGCTIVVKPSELAPLSAFVLAEVIDDAGLPPGVFNLVTGTGPVVGEALAAHPLVDMVSLTGSLRSGRRVAELAAAGVKRVTLELGGKSATVLLQDADLQRAVEAGVAGCFLNSGQTCSALTRMIVPRSLLADVEDLAKHFAQEHVVGDPRADGTRLGPLVSSGQRERVLGYIRRGMQEGARLVTGGLEPPEGLERGYYVRPTVFSDVRSDMVIAQEEIFGPVLAIIPYDGDAEEAVELANGTIYGLAGAVWSKDASRAAAVARRMRAGQVEVNGAGFNPTAPFGGYKQSGIGRELGRFGLEEYLEVKSLQL